VGSIDPLSDVRGQFDTVRHDVEHALSAPVEPVSASDLPPAPDASISEAATTDTAAKAGGNA
jgi:hypothetical protein